MVRSTKPANAADASDDDWDVVSPNTAAVMRADEPNEGGGAQAHAPAEEDQEQPAAAENSSDRLSFVMVGATMVRMSGDAAEPAAAAAEPAEPEQQPIAVEAPAEKPQQPKKRTPKQSPASPPEPVAAAATPEEAARRMAESPALPGVSPTAPALPVPSPPPAAVLAAPTAPLSAPSSGSTDARCLRNMGTLSSDEATQRGVVGREAEVEHRRILNDLRLERQRMGDTGARPTAAGDEAIARRVAAEESRAASEAVARRRQEEEMRSAEALLQERRAAEAARARAGPKRCDCLGASAGHHRPSCPERAPVE
jgi:hypothetical protein